MGNVLIVGSGIAGMQASIDLADLGHRVFLLEKEAELGGNLRNLSEVSPGHRKASELLSSCLKRIGERKNIIVLRSAEMMSFEGAFPKFEVSVKTPDKKTDLEVNAVILSTGIRSFDPLSLRLYGYGRFKDVVTSSELEQMVRDGKLVRPSNSQQPEAVAFIQCVGSRDLRANDYCSDFCCNNSVKLARIIKQQHPTVNVSVFHIDMRTPYEGELEFKRARRLGVRFPRGKPARIRAENGSLVIQVEDTLENDLVYCPFDLVVLSVGGVSDPTAKELKNLMNVDVSESGFFIVDERTLQSNVKGIFVAGAANGPRDIACSMIQGSSAATRVDALLRTVKA